jgi:hypothetical protein
VEGDGEAVQGFGVVGLLAQEAAELAFGLGHFAGVQGGKGRVELWRLRRGSAHCQVPVARGVV